MHPKDRSYATRHAQTARSAYGKNRGLLTRFARLLGADNRRIHVTDIYRPVASNQIGVERRPGMVFFSDPMRRYPPRLYVSVDVLRSDPLKA